MVLQWRAAHFGVIENRRKHLCYNATNMENHLIIEIFYKLHIEITVSLNLGIQLSSFITPKHG